MRNSGERMGMGMLKGRGRARAREGHGHIIARHHPIMQRQAQRSSKPPSPSRRAFPQPSKCVPKARSRRRDPCRPATAGSRSRRSGRSRGHSSSRQAGDRKREQGKCAARAGAYLEAEPTQTRRCSAASPAALPSPQQQKRGHLEMLGRL